MLVSGLIWKWFYYCFQNLELLPPQFENPWETNTSFFLHVGWNKIIFKYKMTKIPYIWKSIPDDLEIFSDLEISLDP